MNKNFCVGVLIVCFGSSSVNLAWAADGIAIAPVIVQPYGVQALNQDMLNHDRQNQDEEIAIKKLIEENNELTQSTLAHEEDEGLAKVNQTMLSYRNTLVSRDRVNTAANGVKWTSRYGDLVALTEDADAMTTDRGFLEGGNDLIAQKYQMLTQLKDEMTDLNEKLKGQQGDSQREAIIDNYKKIAEEQQDKIQMLVDNLSLVDKKIAEFDAVLAQKDQQIAQLKDNLARAQNDTTTKDETISEQKNQIGILERQSPVPPSAMGNASNSQAGHQDNTALMTELSSKDEIIKQQENQIAVLKALADNTPSSVTSSSVAGNNVALSPIIVNTYSNQQNMPQDNKALIAQLLSKDATIKEQENQIAILKAAHNVAVSPIIVNASSNQLSSKDAIIKQQENQIAALEAQSQELSSKEGIIKSQADQMARASEQFKNQSTVYAASVQSEVTTLRDKMHQQDIELKAKDDSIHWLNQVLAAAKNKAEYYKLTSQQEQMSAPQVAAQLQNIKNDFAQRFKEYNQLENAIVPLKDQVSQLSLELSQKQEQVDSLKTQLADKTTQQNNQNNQIESQAQQEQDLKAQLLDKENQIVKMKTDIQAILQNQENKNDHFKLAKELIGLQEQEASLLDEKDNLEQDQNALFDRHVLAYETKIKELLVKHQIQTADLQNYMHELKNELDQKEGQVDLLKSELENKITEAKNQGTLVGQVQDLQSQLASEENQIAVMKTSIQSGADTDALKQQLAAEQDKEMQLKQQLDNKIAESNQMTLMMADYQKKLESKNSDYNEQFGKMLSSKNYQAQMQKQIDDLNARLQDREAQVIKIKKDMYDLQELANAKETNAQARDLNLSMIQEKVMDAKINGLQVTNDQQAQEVLNLKTQLALARQELNGMPSSDEIEFLRTGLKKATLELKRKDAMFLQIKANADEYAKEFKAQTMEFKSLKNQLQSAYDDLHQRNEDLRYKNMEVIRLKERSTVSQGDLEDQVRVLTQKLAIAQHQQKRPMGNVKIHGNTVEALQAQLMDADEQIKDLRAQLNQFELFSKHDPTAEKLRQAVDKIDEQGRIINVLVQKLQDAGQSVDLSKVVSK